MKTMEQAGLSPENTGIQERSVTIRVLTVGTKQVTQSLYQQLIDDGKFVDDTGFIVTSADIWGWVNVCTHLCKRLGDSHIHVIYEQYGVLKRARVSRGFMAEGTTGDDIRDALRKARDPKDRATLQDDLIAYQEQWRRTLQRIQDAGQLFIAVSGVWK